MLGVYQNRCYGNIKGRGEAHWQNENRGGSHKTQGEKKKKKKYGKRGRTDSGPGRKPKSQVERDGGLGGTKEGVRHRWQRKNTANRDKARRKLGGMQTGWRRGNPREGPMTWGSLLDTRGRMGRSGKSEDEETTKNSLHKRSQGTERMPKSGEQERTNTRDGERKRLYGAK